jgi:hypothetical protein
VGVFHYEAKTSKPDQRLSGDRRVEGDGRSRQPSEGTQEIQRQRAERKAAANRLVHGRSKADRLLDAERNAKSHRDLDRHLIETGDDR